MTLGLPERIESKISPEPNSGCWLWDASLKDCGYGNVRWRGVVQPAHRVVYECLVGPIPDALVLDHKCRLRCCVNPEHLEIVTEQTNILRGVGMAAQWAKRTHCAKGHPFSGDNLRTEKRSRARICYICRSNYLRDWKAKNK
jgi:hypothetical protein